MPGRAITRDLSEIPLLCPVTNDVLIGVRTIGNVKYHSQLEALASIIYLIMVLMRLLPPEFPLKLGEYESTIDECVLTPDGATSDVTMSISLDPNDITSLFVSIPSLSGGKSGSAAFYHHSCRERRHLTNIMFRDELGGTYFIYIPPSATITKEKDAACYHICGKIKIFYAESKPFVTRTY